MLGFEWPRTAQMALELFFRNIFTYVQGFSCSSKQFHEPAKIAKKLSDLIPPVFYKNRFITDFREKAALFNSFFANQCSLIITNTSALPTDYEQMKASPSPLQTVIWKDNKEFPSQQIL